MEEISKVCRRLEQGFYFLTDAVDRTHIVDLAGKTGKAWVVFEAFGEAEKYREAKSLACDIWYVEGHNAMKGVPPVAKIFDWVAYATVGEPGPDGEPEIAYDAYPLKEISDLFLEASDGYTIRSLFAHRCDDGPYQDPGIEE